MLKLLIHLSANEVEYANKPKKFSLQTRNDLKKDNPADSNRIPGIQESISFERQYKTKDSLDHGPVIPYYFHEVVERTSWGKKTLDLIFASLLIPLFLILYPFIWIFSKVKTRGPVIVSTICPGYRGIDYKRLLFNYGNIDGLNSNPSLIGNVLYKTCIYRLPMILNIFRGEMGFVGAWPYSEAKSLDLNERFVDYYKRYAAKPGMISPKPANAAQKFTNKYDEHYIELYYDLRYTRRRSAIKDLKIILSRLVGR